MSKTILLEKLQTVEGRYNELTHLLSEPEVLSNFLRYQKYSKEQAEIAEIVGKFREYKKILADIHEAEEILGGSVDDGLKELASAELTELKEKKSLLENELRLMLIPADPRDKKNIILEIRAGTGGEEAALFAAELFRMYSKYAENKRWKVEVININFTGLNGIKEAIASIQGKGAYSHLKYESGVHRVQRVPLTEGSGRIHTSAATVAVLPEAEDVDIKIDEKNLRIDTFCASGPGGQGVNTTYSAVRILHIPTGMIVQCQDERSQIKNKEKAMKVLRSRLYELELEKQEKERALERRTQVGTGDRSERIRTYNFPQNRVTDHRIRFTLYKLGAVLDGDLDEIIDSVHAHYLSESLKKV